jgi:lincosamide nucleotidyltransferase A/C/D/E
VLGVVQMIEMVRLLTDNGIEVWIDGGWGVDALLGRQTREHEDLDIAIEHRHVPKLRTLFEERGYRDVPRDDTRDCNFVLGDDQGRILDIHTFTFDEDGNNIFGCEYPLDSLTGSGTLRGYDLKCISAEWAVKFHSGYELKRKDYDDVRGLCDHFGIALPAEYLKFVSDGDSSDSTDGEATGR